MLYILSILSIILGFIIFSEITMYRPPKIEKVTVLRKIKGEKFRREFSILTWNVGYGGLGKNADFFMSGGKTSKPANKRVVEENMNSILSFLYDQKFDFILLQEVDLRSSRTYKINEVELFSRLPYLSYFAMNYNVQFVPVPLLSPIGKVKSGIMMLSKFEPYRVERYALPGDLEWPRKLFELKRAFLLTRYRVDSHDLLILNLHLSAFDDGKLRMKELEYIKSFILKEYEKGNYVIVGGDWNLIMPGLSKKHFEFTTSEKYLKNYLEFPLNWTQPGWQWAFDPNTPTNRSNERPFVKGENFVTVIDGFLVSPNLEMISVKTIDLGFENSDHNPVHLKIKLKGEFNGRKN
ncbi:endonuclease/exonuclease/phosphatase family protein [Athalassotoga saccharophila]|uniref:endonuclease/exonuclease/phosphatase family protein n=1 Tax=Athalassotoga saccharophila TaxID=1441386 RepID=UPI00137A18E8|nr:endonuclease/exonuclease/phosphatase family protein [Athalassotoga saccharophila]BBJ28202.1 endonuclease/exonuclease/phosphatase family protein [Athalassotoga saccharophila]